MTMTPAEITARMNEVDDSEQLHPPSPEQVPVVTASWNRPALVVAGAGSGKTETMANRLLWLVANGLVQPEQVLGLTFTRKAAGELAERFSQRLQRLESAGLHTPVEGAMPPTVSTYNSFANEVFREFAYLIGRSPDAEVLTEATARVLAREVVLASTDSRLAAFGRVDRVVDLLVQLAAEMGDNLLRASDLREHPGAVTAEIERLLLPDGITKGNTEKLEKILEAMEGFEALLDLVDAYESRKRERNALTFSDQVRLAIEVLERVPSVAEELRARHPIVLLDEYQDTSVMQVRLLSALYGGSGVMAVGDPNQSIYEWRGAAAGTLERFLEDFGGSADDRYELSMSWRNDREILTAANRLAADAGGTVMALRPRPGAGEGAVESVFAEQLADEAAAMASWLAAQIDGASRGVTAAMLLRSRTWMRAYMNALDDAGVDYVVVGGGGLLSEPAIVDLVATLRVLGAPEASQSLVRIMASARWRIGVADMRALARFARAFAALDAEPEGATAATAEQISSIIDALDALPDASRLRLPTAEFSEDGLRRLTLLARELRELRAMRHRSALELVTAVVRTTGLDIELESNPHADARVLPAFIDELNALQRHDSTWSLQRLLAWIDVLERDDRLELPPPEAVPGQVQVMTIHAAKGLEWDVVAMPALSEGTFPGTARGLSGGLTAETVPHSFRGDATALPTIDFAQFSDATEAVAGLDAYRAANRSRQLAEEGRVAYVGVTRAKRALWLSGHGLTPDGSRPKKPSAFLESIGGWKGLAAQEAQEGSQRETVSWPPTPFGSRAEAVLQAAEQVRYAAELPDGDVRRHLDALLRESTTESAPPLERVGASRLLEWIDDPNLAERERRRPMPARRDGRALLGTVFHQWTEGRLIGGLAETLPGIDDADVAADGDLAQLQRSYLETRRYADLELLGGSAEMSIDLRIAGVTVSCKIDAVFEVGDRILIVDWKTGRAPQGAQLERRLRQLSLYRIAYSELTGTPLERIDAEFFFAGDGTITPLQNPMSKDDLAALIESARRSG